MTLPYFLIYQSSLTTMEISEITHDKESNQLYLETRTETKSARAYVKYEIKKDIMNLTDSKVPKALRGKGIGKILVEKSLEKLIEEGYDKEYKIIAKCSFIKYVVAKNPKWSEIVSK